MPYLIAASLVFGSSLAFCLFFDISPSAALREAKHLLLRGSRTSRPTNPDSPYHRIVGSQNETHRPILLNLDTSDGSGQATHPDVVYIPEGFGFRRWPYWMVCTPYPYAQNCPENPELFVSCDGITWLVPDGAQNPLVPTPKTSGGHNSDPDMVFHEKKLWLFYRQTLRSNGGKKDPLENAIYLMKSLDGVQWSSPKKILSENTGSQLLSPAVIHDCSSFVMWTVEIHKGELKLMRRSSPDAENWSSPEPCLLIGLGQGRYPWHIDVTREANRLSAILVSYLGLGHSGGSGSRIHYAYSEDNGRTWFGSNFLLDQVYEFESQLQYRGSLRLLDEDRQLYGLWYSAASQANVFSIAYVSLARVGDRLVPLPSSLATPIVHSRVTSCS